MTDSTNETVEAQKELSAVEQAQARIEAKRKELADLQNEGEVTSRAAEEAVALAQLAAEEQRIETELAYQRRLKVARDAQLNPQPAPLPETALPEVPASPTPVVAPEVASVEATAKTNTAGKGK